MPSQFDDKNRLIEALCEQEIVNHDREVASELADVVQILECNNNDVLITQNHLTTELYFILSGEVHVHVNGRKKAIRKKGQQVGEMALIDPGAKRSATVSVGTTNTTVAKIEEAIFMAQYSEVPCKKTSAKE